MTITRVTFIRHGRTADNLAGVFQGQSGRGLDDIGREQAARLAARLSGRAVSLLLSSDLDRAIETAAVIGAAIDRAPAFDHAFREIDVGGWGGLTAEQAAARFPGEHADWRDGKDVRRGGGESYSEVAERIDTATRRVIADHSNGHVMIVSHGTAIRCFAARLVGAPAQASRAWPVMQNCALSTFSFEAGQFRLLSWNDASHLE